MATAVYGIVNNLFNTRPSFAGKSVLFRKLWNYEFYIQNEKMNLFENAVHLDHENQDQDHGSHSNVVNADVHQLSMRVRTNLYHALGYQQQKKRNHFCKIVAMILRSLLRNIVQLRRHFMIIWWLKEPLDFPAVFIQWFFVQASKSVKSSVAVNIKQYQIAVSRYSSSSIIWN